jgi:hypothetical protein
MDLGVYYSVCVYINLHNMHMHGDWKSVHSVGQDLPEYVQVKGKIYVVW